MRSEKGEAYHTPSIGLSITCGKIRSKGKRKMSWRVSERKMLLPAMPMLWKKAVETICTPTIGKNITKMRRPCAAPAMSSGASLAKSVTQGSAKNVPTKKPMLMMQTPAMSASLST